MKARKILSAIMAIAMIAAFAVSASAAEDVTLPNGVTTDSFGDNTVTDGTTYYATITAALAGVHGTDNAVLYCKPGADVGEMSHGHVCKNLTVYGNGAYISGGEQDFEIDFPAASGSNCTGLTGDVTLTVDNLTGAGAWGSKTSEHEINLVFTNCEKMSKIFFNGTAGALNIDMEDCTFTAESSSCSVYSNTFGEITLDNVNFTGVAQPVALNNKSTGTQTIVMKNCDFANCGASTADWTVPVSVKSSVEGGTSVLTVDNCTFTETVTNSVGQNADIILDYGVGTATANISSTSARVLVETEANVGTAEEITASETKSFTNVETATPVAKIGDVEYTDLQTAINDAADGAEIVLLNNLEQKDGIIVTDKKITLDLAKYTFTVTEGSSTNSRNFLINGSSVVTIKNGTLVGAGDINSGTYGTIRTEGTANVTLTGLKLYNYRGNGLNIKALTGTTVNISDTEIYSTYGGGIEAAGAEMELTNVTVEQKGMWTAPYNSMAISVNGGGTVIVNSGSYTTEPLAAEDAYSQGSSHGSWAAGVLNSGGTLIIKGGTFRNGNFGDDSLATAARGLILADTGANIQIEGGTFNALKSVIDIQNNLGDASKNPTGTIIGGTFSADPTNNYVKIADGYTITENSDGTYGVVEEAEIDPAFGTTLGVARIGANEEDYELVLLGAIDSLNYKDVGFEITFNDKVHELKTKTVYTKVTSTNADTEEVEDYTSKVLGGAENGYVFGQMLGFALDDTDKEFTCRLFAINLNDEYVFGKTWTIPVIEQEGE